jgi:hypothetical protein
LIEGPPKQGAGLMMCNSHTPNAVDITVIEAQAAIEAARTVIPFLTATGLGAWSRESRQIVFEDPEISESRSLLTVAGVSKAISFLSKCRRARKPCVGSYGLKHAVEFWGGGYVSNGEVILAAAWLDFDFEPSFGPNASIAVNYSDVARLDPRTAWGRGNRSVW